MDGRAKLQLPKKIDAPVRRGARASAPVGLAMILLLVSLAGCGLFRRGGTPQPTTIPTTNPPATAGAETGVPPATVAATPAPATTQPTVIPLSTSPIFGVQVLTKGVNSAPGGPQSLQALHVKVTILWLYYPAAGADQAWVQRQKSLVEGVRRDTGGLDVYVHIMPNDPTAQPAFHMPPNMSNYTRILTALASALQADGVRYYSIGNEFSGYTFRGSVSDYQTLLSESGRAIKAGNPNALILDSGIAGELYQVPISKMYYDRGNLNQALSFIQQFEQHQSILKQLPTDQASYQRLLQSSLGQSYLDWSSARFTSLCPYYDVLELHDYQGWETMQTVYDYIKGQMQQNNCVKPIQVWELGYGDNKSAVDLQDQARAVAKMVTIAAGEGSQMINYFPLVDTGTQFKGLYRRNEPLPAATAFGTTTGKLTGTTGANRLSLGANIWGYEFVKGGKNLYVVWSSSNTSVQLPFSGAASVTDIMGNVTEVNSNTVSISTSPVFVEP